LRQHAALTIVIFTLARRGSRKRPDPPLSKRRGRDLAQRAGDSASCPREFTPKATYSAPNLDVLARECEWVGLGLSVPGVAPCMTVFSPVIRRGFSSWFDAFEEPPRMSSERDICLRRADEAKQRAAQSTEPSIKSAYEKVAEHWMLLAQLDSLVAAEINSERSLAKKTDGPTALFGTCRYTEGKRKPRACRG
jgi:hypothetical protein